MGGPAAPAKAKVKTNEKKKVPVPTRYFGFLDGAETTDLKANPLRIKQEKLFIPEGKDTLDVLLEIYEMRGQKTEKKNTLLLKIHGKVTKADGFNFRVEKVEQDEKAFPKRKNEKGTELWLPTKLEVLGTDDKKRGLGESAPIEIVLPPMEYDEELELQMGATLPGSIAAGPIKVGWDSYDAMMKGLNWTELPPAERLKDQGTQISKGGNLELVVVHSMSAINEEEAKDDPAPAFRVDLNVGLLRRIGFSAHFIIDRDGKIVQAVHQDRQAAHAFSKYNRAGFSKVNQLSIGIELLGFPDQFREGAEKKYRKEAKEKVEAQETLDELKAALAKRNAEKASGIKEVTVGGKKMPIDESIAKIKAGIADAEDKVKTAAISTWAKNYEKFTAAKDTDGVPLVYKYTKAQYESLGKLVEVYGKRYGYKTVCSHKYIIPVINNMTEEDKASDKPPQPKTDPGKFFVWDELTPYLLPGTLSGDEAESGKGGIYKVK